MKVLIGCCKRKTKAAIALPPYRLYQGTLFQAQLRYASWVLGADYADIYILSAKYGLISLLTPIEYYNGTLPAAEGARVAWAKKVSGQIAEAFAPGERLYVLAGSRYRQPLIGMLNGFEVNNPVPAGMGYGQQVNWLYGECKGCGQ